MYSQVAADALQIEKVKNGDCDAFAPLIERYKLLVYRLIYRMVGNRDDTEDLVQEVFIKAYRNMHRFKNGMPFYPWLARIATNHTINFLKREPRNRIDPLETVEGSLVGNRDDPVDMTRLKTLKERITEAMNRLPCDYRTVLVLRVEQELSYAEIGKTLRIPPGTVMSRLARARQRLREIFQEMGVHQP